MSRPDPAHRPIVIGVGNRDRGDDGVGPFVADLVRTSTAAAVETAVVEGDLSDLSLLWDADRMVLVVDAMTSGRDPGAIEVIDGLATELASERRPVSSHGVGLADAIGLARALGRLPRALTIVAIEGRSFERFDPLSDPVRAAGLEAADRIPGLIEGSDAGPTVTRPTW